MNNEIKWKPMSAEELEKLGNDLYEGELRDLAHLRDIECSDIVSRQIHNQIVKNLEKEIETLKAELDVTKEKNFELENTICRLLVIKEEHQKEIETLKDELSKERSVVDFLKLEKEVQPFLVRFRAKDRQRQRERK